MEGVVRFDFGGVVLLDSLRSDLVWGDKCGWVDWLVIGRELLEYLRGIFFRGGWRCCVSWVLGFWMVGVLFVKD